jgi:voltage-gated potassium channel
MSSLRRFVVSLLLLLVLTLGGTLAYMQLEGWSFTDALYMAVITISTVGFGEVRALSPMGEVFTIAYIFFSVVLVGFAGASITAFLVQGELRALMKGRRMQHRIDHLKDHYIICGCGAVGREIVQEFHEEGVPYVVIELNAEDAEVPRNIDVPVLEGDATSDEVLLLAGIERAKGLISALHDDPQNVFVTLSARQLNPKLQIVSRASEEGTESKLLRAGADRVISPFEIAGRRMAATVLRPHVLSFLDVLFRQGGVKPSVNWTQI